MTFSNTSSTMLKRLNCGAKWNDIGRPPTKKHYIGDVGNTAWPLPVRYSDLAGMYFSLKPTEGKR